MRSQESWEDLLESDDDAWDADKEPTSPIVEEVVEDIEDLRSRGDELRTWWLDRKSSPEYAAMRDQRASFTCK